MRKNIVNIDFSNSNGGAESATFPIPKIYADGVNDFNILMIVEEFKLLLIASPNLTKIFIFFHGDKYVNVPTPFDQQEPVILDIYKEPFKLVRV
jgi:hypothetical protein